MKSAKSLVGGLCLIVLLPMLQACGQKGPLRLPERAADAAPSAASAPASGAAKQP